MDVLSEMLNTIRVTSAAFVEAELKAPWSFLIPTPAEIVEALMPAAEHVASCHVITQGGCTVRLANGADIELAAGEVVMFPRGDQHVICRTSQRAPDELTMRDISKFFSRDKMKPLRCGGAGDATGVISGFFSCDPQFSEPMLVALPSVMRISLRSDPRARWLQGAVRFSAHESAHARAGAASMLTKLSELLFGEAVRRHLEHAPLSQAGWLGGLRDPQTAKVLTLMHRQPENAWTLATLADEVGLARSTLTERFTRVVAEPPMQYLKRLRLRIAADRLLDGQSSVGRVAEQAGYGSEAAFTRAFKREFGLPPAAWRKRRAAPVAPKPHE